MNPFERFKIKHLSPSSINLYSVNPSLWVGKYLLKWVDESGPAAFRGSSVEAGLDVFLFERKTKEAEDRALAKFAELTQGQADDEYEAERANIVPMLRQAIEALKDAPVPLGRQLRAEYAVDGVDVPLIGYIDWAMPEWDLDLKSTKACPSSIKADHGRQFAFYNAARKRPIKALYVTAKKSALYDLTPEDAAIHLRDLERGARAIQHMLSKVDSPRDAARLFGYARDDFRWSDALLEKTNEVWETA